MFLQLEVVNDAIDQVVERLKGPSVRLEEQIRPVLFGNVWQCQEGGIGRATLEDECLGGVAVGILGGQALLSGDAQALQAGLQA